MVEFYIHLDNYLNTGWKKTINIKEKKIKMIRYDINNMQLYIKSSSIRMLYPKFIATIKYQVLF